MILGNNNTATGATQIGNGTLTVGNTSSNENATLGTGNLTLAQTSTSSNSVAFQNTAQTNGALKSSFSDTASGAKETQTITLSGNNTVGTVLTVNETGPTTFGNNGCYAAQSSTIGGIGSLVLSAASTSALTLNSANTYTGGTTINGGTLQLNFAAVAANPTANPPATGMFPAASNILAPTGALAMGGGTLRVNGPTSGTTSPIQTVASLAVNPGASAIIDSSNGVDSTLMITSSTINRSVGGTLNFTPPTIGSIGFAGATPTLTGGILGGWATVNGTDWATIAGGNIVGLSTQATNYTNDNWASGANTTVTKNDTPAAGSTTNSLQFNSGAGAVTVTLSGTNVITTGGILVTPAAALGSTISGDTLEGAAGADLVVIQNSATPLTISSVVADNGAATGLTLSGGGTLALTGGNTYSGATFINSGTLQIGGGGASGSLGAGAVVDNATLSFNRNDTALVVNNVISGTGAINQIGTGTTMLAAANTFTGGTSISDGTLQLANANALQNSTVTIGVANGLTFSPSISTFTIGGLAGSADEQLQATGGGTFATLQVGNNASSTANPAYSGVLSGSGGLTKIGAGTQTLSGANIYGGSTAVNSGTLALDFTAAGAPSSNILPSGTTLNLGGGTLLVNGANSGGGSSQTIASLTVIAGASAIVNVSNNSISSTLTITSPSIGRTIGGTVDFTSPAGAPSATNGIITTAVNTNGILGGWATVGGTDWATVSGGNIVALPALSYTNDTWAAGANTTVTQNDTPASGSTTNSLQFASTAAGNQITLSGTNVITSGGILVSSAFTAAGTISGGTIKGASGGDLVVIQNSVSDFSISSVIADNGGPTSLTKSGPGTLVLGGTSANNTFTSGVYINQGTILLNAGNFWTSGGIVNPPSGQVFSASNTVNFGSNAPSLNPASWNTVGSIPTLNLAATFSIFRITLSRSAP